MEQLLGFIGKFMFGLRFIMSAFYLGLIVVMMAILWKFGNEVISLVLPMKVTSMTKMDLIIKVLELVDMTMVAQPPEVSKNRHCMCRSND